MAVTWAADTIIAAHEAVLAQIDADGSAAYVEIRDADDILLSTLPMQYPAATVNQTTGVMTFAIGARDEEAEATGTAAKAQLKSQAGTLIGEFTCSEGSAAVANTCVLSTLSIISGAPVEILSFVIGNTHTCSP